MNYNKLAKTDKIQVFLRKI